MLDLVIVSNDLVEYVDTMEIDDRYFRFPGRPMKNGKIKYSDHRAIKITFKGIPKEKDVIKTGVKVTRWNTQKEGGWRKYKEMTSNNEVFRSIANDPSDNPESIMNKIEKELVHIKHVAFG